LLSTRQRTCPKYPLVTKYVNRCVRYVFACEEINTSLIWYSTDHLIIRMSVSSHDTACEKYYILSSDAL
jgi:hypothetical protein